MPDGGRRTAPRSRLVFVSLLAARTAGAASHEKQDVPPNVQIHEAYAQVAVCRAMARASERLASPECQQLLTEFADAAGRPLRAVMEERGFEADTYMRHMRFYDGTI